MRLVCSMVTRQVCLKINTLSHACLWKYGKYSASAYHIQRGFGLVGYGTQEPYIFPHSTRACVITCGIYKLTTIMRARIKIRINIIIVITKDQNVKRALGDISSVVGIDVADRGVGSNVESVVRLMGLVFQSSTDNLGRGPIENETLLWTSVTDEIWRAGYDKRCSSICRNNNNKQLIRLCNNNSNSGFLGFSAIFNKSIFNKTLYFKSISAFGCQVWMFLINQ